MFVTKKGIPFLRYQVRQFFRNIYHKTKGVLVLLNVGFNKAIKLCLQTIVVRFLISKDKRNSVIQLSNVAVFTR